MENIKNNLEQPDELSSQGEAVSQNVTSGVEVSAQSGSKLGKFKNAEALLTAYNNLQSDYTKKCQSLAQLEKQQEENANTAPSSTFNWQENAKSFFENNPRAKKYESELAKIVMEDNLVSNSTNPLEQAWNKFVSSKFLDENEIITNETFLQNHIFNNEEIKNKIIQNYFNSLNFGASPTLIATQKGSASVLSPQTKPKTIKEAHSIVEDIFS